MKTLKIKLHPTNKNTPDTLNVSLDNIAEFIAGYIISHEQYCNKKGQVIYKPDMISHIEYIIENGVEYDDNDLEDTYNYDCYPLSRDLRHLEFEGEDAEYLKSKLFKIFKIDDSDEDIDIDRIVSEWTKWFNDSYNSDRIPGVCILDDAPEGNADEVIGFDKELDYPVFDFE